MSMKFIFKNPKNSFPRSKNVIGRKIKSNLIMIYNFVPKIFFQDKNFLKSITN